MDNEQRPNAASPVHWDAQVWKAGELWQQLIEGAVGAGAAQGGAAHLCTSPDLEEWTHRGTIAEDHDPERRYWELPYLVPYGAEGAPDGDRTVLMVGAHNNPYATGSYDPVARRFHPDRREPRFVDLGPYYCVNPHLVDDRGPDGAPCRLLLDWVLGAGSPVDTAPYWIGAHSIPRVLELAGDELVQSPVPEIATLLGTLHRQRDLTIVPGAQGHLEHVAGDALEQEMTVDLRRTRAHRFGAAVRVPGDGRGAQVWYEPPGNRVGVVRLLGPEQVYATPDALVLRASSEAVTGLAAAAADVSRPRLGLEGSLALELGGGRLTPTAELGLRHDGGDAETGFGLDLSGGLSWSAPALGLAAQVSGRGLLPHEDQRFRDWGVAGSAQLRPDPGLRPGPIALARPAWGRPVQQRRRGPVDPPHHGRPRRRARAPPHRRGRLRPGAVRRRRHRHPVPRPGPGRRRPRPPHRLPPPRRRPRTHPRGHPPLVNGILSSLAMAVVATLPIVHRALRQLAE